MVKLLVGERDSFTQRVMWLILQLTKDVPKMVQYYKYNTKP
jgi:hypothetical protein